ncbi:thioredoxin fold domain-containing protein [Xanthobacter agilis]|uniref:thioredoxin fold domain-containing protein n=1 Tax=Xanthobacter agilis TaxID=47492 RepID=UPI0037290E55
MTPRARSLAVVPALLLALVFAIVGAAPAWAGELVVFERKGCVYCQRFERDVAPLYGKTAEGRRAPLRRVDVSQGPPRDVALAAPVRFTPTFVLVEDGHEVGRITGYASDEAFWGLIGALTARLAPARP